MTQDPSSKPSFAKRAGGKKPGYKGKPKPPPRRPGLPPEGPILLYGLHTVEAAFANSDRKRKKLFATDNALKRLEERGVKIDVPVESAMPRALDRMVTKDAVHQGMILEADPLPAYGPEHLKKGRLILALDQVTDPHNVGAILRSAVALSADAVVTTERHAPEEGPVLAKSASGALDMIKHVRVKNMAKFIAEMRENGYTSIALDSDGPESLENTMFGERTVLVLGSEGKGVRHGVREACDHLARLDMPGEIRSLNVSNAAVLSLYVARQKMGL
ncbi:23S rRNA (guanosine2251-2'-O)-methyltransferase [Roseibium hamelinense]|uniref:23S rRNA (Guanosine2251-2'-O)-methyltransferase n=1 Tax=Roseibium hamelinense TaxID=150831 RepID=A0A562TBW1_9HYPH|nr:RNA methyltransferase [Roseibium hamelinense]MTI42219.1 RNA methyltransferase [Roseibium hamelinense]TWI90566.1 23S rRNA (guanosine2251-2'-O)-methyltransferase [Roseibium hamelinense]